MKKIILVFICLMMVMSVNAQSEVIETQETYCMIVATQNFMSSKCSITIDYGQSTKLIDGSSKMKLVDENGKTVKFNSIMDACNHLASLGWSLVNAYSMVDNKQGSCYHYVFRKTIKKGEQVMFNTKGTKNKTNEEKPQKTNEEKPQKTNKNFDDIYFY